MTNNDFKQLLDEAIKPLQEDINEVKEKLNGVEEEFKGLKEEQSSLREIIEERVLPPLIYIETTVKSYADRYVTNEDHIGRLQKRLNTVEDNLGIQPSQELTIPSLD